MDRKQKEKEYILKHENTFQKLKLLNPLFTLKMAFYEKGKFGRNIQLYESELKKNEDIYMEFIDVVRDQNGVEQDYVSMYEDRPLFKFKANPFYSEEYELRERSGGYSAYIISTSELVMIDEDGVEISFSLYDKRREDIKKQEASLPKLQQTLSIFPDFEAVYDKKEEIKIPSLKTSELDIPISEMTLRDFAAIMLLQESSKKAELNELINKSKSKL